MKYLHTMLRVSNLEESIQFYGEVLGMNKVSQDDYPDGEFTLVFMSFGTSKDDPCLELTYNYGKHSYELGDAYGHIAFGTPDVKAMCEKVRRAGGKITREAGPMKHGTTVIAFIEDPNGYKIELIEKK